MKPSPKRHRPLALLILALTIITGLSACGGGSSSPASYSIGGTVSGLGTSQSLVLQNNGGDDLTVTANGGFTFATTLGGGNVYDVTVLTQPADQTCAVSNGLGSLFGLDVTDVAVSCISNAHTVGGSVSGLGSGNSIVLQNNGGDDLTVSGDGAFTFTTTQVSGTAYNVTVLTSPSEQDCTVGNGSGTISAADVSNIAVVCRTWHTAALIETDNSGAATVPRISADSNGNAVAVWQQFDGGSNYNIWANRYLAGGGWLTPILLGSASVATTTPNPQIASDGNGNAIAVWVQDDIVWNKRYTAGVGWGTASTITTNSGSEQAPQIAVDSNGDAVAVWTYLNGAQREIWANHYTAGWGWGQAAAIGDNSGDATLPQVTMDADGNAVAVWVQGGTVRSNRYTAAVGWGTATTITSNTDSEDTPRIAGDTAGDAVAVWTHNNGGQHDVWANRYTVGLGWGQASIIGNNAGDAANPVVAVAGDGSAVAAWQQSDGMRTNIWANRYASANWGSAALIENDDSGNAAHPEIAVSGDGEAVAVWQQYYGTTIKIWTNRYSAGGAWDSAALIENDNSGDAQLPQISIGGSADAVAVWQQSDGSRTNIWANVYR